LDALFISNVANTQCYFPAGRLLKIGYLTVRYRGAENPITFCGQAERNFPTKTAASAGDCR